MKIDTEQDNLRLIVVAVGVVLEAAWLAGRVYLFARACDVTLKSHC